MLSVVAGHPAMGSKATRRAAGLSALALIGLLVFGLGALKPARGEVLDPLTEVSAAPPELSGRVQAQRVNPGFAWSTRTITCPAESQWAS